LAAGLEAGFSLKDTFDGNSPYTFANGNEVVNEGPGDGNDYGSAISLVTATEESVNTAYSDLTESIGPKKILDEAVALGIPRRTPGLEANDAIALGSATISPITMANAYASIANAGRHHDVFTVKKVTRASDGKVLWRNPRKSNRVLSEDIAADTSYAMQQVVQNGTGRNALVLGRPAAGKTGTATNADGDVSSSWFVGYTPQVATAVMYVRGKGNEALNGYLSSYFGANYPTYTWRAVMGAVLDGTPSESFPPPAYVDGQAPADGHAPYTPPPPPAPAPTKKNNNNKPRQTQAPQAPATTAPATPKPTPDNPPPAKPSNGNGGGGGGTACAPTDPNCTP
ncbi:MAG: glycosyl transferase, family 51, partial [Marmoricola sp.]|nr:glycosyl transferase, family 51 [Marmoricola sp.]